MGYDLARMRDMSGKVAIVGVGDTDYHADYAAARVKDPNYHFLDSEGLAMKAFYRALEDSGLKKEDIDGLGVSGPVIHERMAELLGIQPKLNTSGSIWDTMSAAVNAIYSGQCETVALVYGLAQRSMGVRYGGAQIRGGPMSYYYYHPWGWSSQGAHWALMFKHHQLKYGSTEEQLGAVAVTIRNHATLNPNAVMHDRPMTLDDYMQSRYVCRPLHLFDYCLVNDGGVCIILRRADKAKDLPHAPVLVDGYGVTTGGKDNTQMQWLVEDMFYTYLSTSGKQAFDMAGMSPKDIDHLQPYDAATVHVPIYLEGFGFTKQGEGLEFCQDGRIGLGGELPVNTSGGMMSESYMMGWNHVVEAVRQLRHEAGARQVKDVETSMFCHCSMIGAYPFIFRRGA
ncbi:MAG: thiolase family protein [Dehalococcoidia bacterium]|nr:thiolase family protein [Dehalococcoidia bacterium]